MRYPRTGAQRAADHAQARANELMVGEWLGPYKVGNLDATDRMDWWVPGLFIDVKEKKQRLTARWPLPDTCTEPDAFVLDELSIRRAMAYFPHGYFIMHDVPGGDRWFLARIDEIVLGDRARLNREGSTGVKKGKHVLDLRQFRQLLDPAAELMPAVLADQIAMPWKQSACLHPTPEEATP
jgi:hypothetical protein